MEYWYDIYALTEQRNLETIERFLCQFADREKIESRKNNVITMIPDLPISEKHKLFISPQSKLNFLHLHGFNRGYFKLPTHLQVTVNSLSGAIQLGLSMPNMGFSLYIRDNTRSDVKCLILSFIPDNKLIMGVSVADKDKYGQENWKLVQNICKELEESLPTKSVSIQFEHPPSDSEEDFVESKKVWDTNLTPEGFDENFKYNRRYNYVFDVEHGLFYFTFRNQLHQYYRKITVKVIYPNTTDYFTLGDAQGNLINIIKYNGDLKSSRTVANPHAKDAAKLDNFHYLFDEAIKGKRKDFTPASIHKVSFPKSIMVERIWRGHRDMASDLTFYEGVRYSKLTIQDTYALDDTGDMKRLVEEGFFLSEDGLLSKRKTKTYWNWLVKY